MKAIHAICHRINGEPQNLEKIDPRNGIYASGWWKVPPEDAASLVGGWLYLHESSGKRSHFLAKIQSIGKRRPDGKIQFVVTKRATIPDQLWRGRKPGQNPEDYYRIEEEATYPHEVDET